MVRGAAKFPFTLIQAIVLCIFFTPSVCAQTPTIAVGAVYGTAGTQVDVPIYFTAGSAGVVSLQFDLTLPAELSTPQPPVISAGAAALAADKGVMGSILPTGKLRFVVFGINQKSLADGLLATFRLNIATVALQRTLPITINDVLAADWQAASVSISGTGGMVVTKERFLWQRTQQPARQTER